MGDDLKEVVGEAVGQTAGQVVGQLIKSAADDPKLKQAGQKFAGAILTVAKAVNVALLPLAAVNFGYEKARVYFEERFGADMAVLTASIPPDQLVLPKASVAGPAVQALAFTHEEPDLKAMYLNLLAAAMHARQADKAHPAFVEIIKQLTSEEARSLKNLLGREMASLPIAEIRSTGADGNFEVLQTHVMNWQNTKTDEQVESSKMVPLVDNWIRLGLVVVDYHNRFAGTDTYAWVLKRPEYKAAKERSIPGRNATYQPGVLEATEFGKMFAAAVGLRQTKPV